MARGDQGIPDADKGMCASKYLILLGKEGITRPSTYFESIGPGTSLIGMVRPPMGTLAPWQTAIGTLSAIGQKGQ